MRESATNYFHSPHPPLSQSVKSVSPHHIITHPHHHPYSSPQEAESDTHLLCVPTNRPTNQTTRRRPKRRPPVPTTHHHHHSMPGVAYSRSCQLKHTHNSVLLTIICSINPPTISPHALLLHRPRGDPQAAQVTCRKRILGKSSLLIAVKES